MVTLPERPVFPNIPPIHIEGVSITAFTPPYPASSSDGLVGIVNAADGELGFNVAGEGYLEGDATLGLGSYTATATDYQLRFYPQVQYSYSWTLVSVYSEPVISSAFFRIVVYRSDTDGAFQSVYDQTVNLWNEILISASFDAKGVSNSGYLNNYPEIVLDNVIAGSTYSLAITCLGTSEAGPRCLAIGLLDASIPYVIVENFSTS